MFFVYTWRSVVARRAAVVPTAVAIASAVLVSCVLTAGLASLRRVLVDSGRPDNGVVVNEGTVNDWETTLDLDTVEQLRVAPGVRRDDAGPMVSPELRVQLRVVRADGDLVYIQMRGVDPIAYRVHPQVKVVQGAAPSAEQGGVMVGASLVGKFEGFHVGGTVLVAGRRWPVVGVFDAPGTKFASELWCVRQSLAEVFRVAPISLASFVLEDPSALPGIARRLAALRDRRVEALAEPEYQRRAFRNVAVYLHAVEIVILVLTAVVVFSTTNTMYAAYLERRCELATLHAIGFTKRAVVGLVVRESLLLALASGLLGLGGAALFHGYGVHYPAIGVFFQLRMTADVLAGGALLSVLIGLLGAAVCAQETLRMDTLEALRDV